MLGDRNRRWIWNNFPSLMVVLVCFSLCLLLVALSVRGDGRRPPEEKGWLFHELVEAVGRNGDGPITLRRLSAGEAGLVGGHQHVNMPACAFIVTLKGPRAVARSRLCLLKAALLASIDPFQATFDRRFGAETGGPLVHRCWCLMVPSAVAQSPLFAADTLASGSNGTTVAPNMCMMLQSAQPTASDETLPESSTAENEHAAGIHDGGGPLVVELGWQREANAMSALAREAAEFVVRAFRPAAWFAQPPSNSMDPAEVKGPRYCSAARCQEFAQREVDRALRVHRLLRQQDLASGPPKATLVMLHDGQRRQVAERAAALNQQYAAAHGFGFVRFNATLDADRATAWSKLRALEQAMDGAGRPTGTPPQWRPDWVVWLDADAVVRADAAAESISLQQALLVAAVNDPAAMFSVDPPQWQCERLCSGVFVLGTGRASRALLKEWWEQGDQLHSGTFVRSFPWEQQILNAIVPGDGVVFSEHLKKEGSRDLEPIKVMAVPYCVLNDVCFVGDQSIAGPPVGAVSHCMGETTDNRLQSVDRAAAEADALARSSRAAGGPGGTTKRPAIARLPGVHYEQVVIVVEAVSGASATGGSSVSALVVNEFADAAALSHSQPQPPLVSVVSLSEPGRRAAETAASPAAAGPAAEIALVIMKTASPRNVNGTHADAGWDSDPALAPVQPTALQVTEYALVCETDPDLSHLCSDWALFMPEGGSVIHVVRGQSPPPLRCRSHALLSHRLGVEFVRLSSSGLRAKLDQWQLTGSVL